MSTSLSHSFAWKELLQHRQTFINTDLNTLFQQSALRAHDFSLSVAGIHLDYSKNLITSESLRLFNALAKQQHFDAARLALQQGEKINNTEHRPALHIALRDRVTPSLYIDDVDVINEIKLAQIQMTQFVEALHQGRVHGATGKTITDVVNIGIGGSYLGPKLVVEALQPFWQPQVNCHFIANIDGSESREVLKKLRPETTLFIVASKTFSTQETLSNARLARDWLSRHLGFEAIDNHFVAVSSNNEAARAFGIKEKNIFPMWDWVGGRYSLWSTIGLPIAIAVGMEHFQQLLDGAHAMDQHFLLAPPTENMPFLLAMLQIWYGNFFGAQSQAIIPYDFYLRSLPEYLQQLEMESNGKRVNQKGDVLEEQTGCVIWGGPGTNGQHAYHQLLHQGTLFIPVDFIFSLKTHNPVNNHHALLVANCLSQSRALMVGKTLEQATDELIKKGLSAQEAQALAPHKVIPGNRPSNTLVMEELNPTTLGALIALYEHKVFSQSVIWGINAFDQWGVELGKQLSADIYQAMSQKEDVSAHVDASTAHLLKLFKDANHF